MQSMANSRHVKCTPPPSIHPKYDTSLAMDLPLWCRTLHTHTRIYPLRYPVHSLESTEKAQFTSVSHTLENLQQPQFTHLTGVC